MRPDCLGCRLGAMLQGHRRRCSGSLIGGVNSLNYVHPLGRFYNETDKMFGVCQVKNNWSLDCEKLTSLPPINILK